MIKFSNYPLKLKLLLVPAVATLSFAAYLIYSSLVLSGGNSLLKEIRDAQFPILYSAGENIKSFEGVVESLNTAAATGDADFLDASKAKASEILSRYETLERIDASHKNEIEKLKSGFNAFYALAFDVAQRMSSRTNMPSLLQIKQLRDLRDAYSLAAKSYRDLAEKEFQEAIRKTIERSEGAQNSGAVIGTFMLFVIAVLTLLVNRGIVVLEEVVENRNKMLVSVNSELEQEIQKLKEAEEARSHAEAASLIKDAFLANMSHELRTPMNAVIGLSYLCLQTDLSDKQRDYLQKINGSAKSLLGILNDILDVSKIEAGKMEMDRIPFELEEVMGNLATIVGVRSQEKNLEFLLETAPNVPSSLIGDPLRLGQVLINLAGNAVKFTEKGEVLVQVELEKESGDQVTLRFTVKDTGIGMSQKEINSLFRPFTQADTSITRKFGGTGLGLTISKRLVEMMGGRIWVESAPGLGSKFIFTARFHEAGISGWDSLASGRFRTTGAQFNPVMLVSQFRGARILLVEDDEINQQVAREMLETYGIEVTLAENGEEAIARLKEGQFDGVLMDMQMPVMDGVSTTREIRKDPQYAEMPIIALTANVMVSDQNEILAAGMNDHIGKPIDPDRLVATLARWVHPSRALEASSPGETVPASATEPLPNLPGVTVDASVRRVGGNVALYYSLLDMFRVNERHVVSRIREALASNDPETGERAAHTLKGIAGTLGAEVLQNQAEQLEHDIRDGSFSNVESLLTQIDQEIESLIAKIDQAIAARAS
jgi:signal transduction histidine kinase/DNA-binding response OmpR family regulator